MLSGIPQDSHLGPLLFTLFINDLPSVFRNSNILIYADDIEIFLIINNIEDQVLLQDNINYLTSWPGTSLMELNIKNPTNGFYTMNLEIIFDWNQKSH